MATQIVFRRFCARGIEKGFHAMEQDYDRCRLLAGVGVTASGLMLAGTPGHAREDKKEEVGAVKDLIARAWSNPPGHPGVSQQRS